MGSLEAVPGRPPLLDPWRHPAQPSRVLSCPGAEGWAVGPEVLGFPNGEGQFHD